jgi:hypothetical protein
MLEQGREMNAPASTITAAPLAIVSTAAHDREWWREEAVRTGTDWSGVVGAALKMMIAADIIEQPEPKTMTAWDGPSWRASAKDYHEQRASRRTSETRRAEAQIEARAEILRLLVRQ